MHLTTFRSARPALARLGAAVGLALLSGCATVSLTNLTPSSLPENPSEIYTFTLRVVARSNTVVTASISPHVVVGGQSYDMKPSGLGQGFYEYDYALPAGATQLAYYFLVDYKVEGNGQIANAESYTGISHVDIVHRQVLSLASNRGPVGAQIGVLGRGFTPQDVIYLESTPARTVFESPSAISFFVPAVDTDKTYQVTLGSGGSPIGTFRVDPSNVSVSPASLALATGETQNLTFTLPNPAPSGGLLLDVATDVPESVIMPEVVVPEGQSSVTVPIQGGKPGNGNLILKGFGPGGQITVPVTVTSSSASGAAGLGK